MNNISAGKESIDLSVVIPLHNEESNVKPLYGKLEGVLRGLSKSHEIIFVDDGSSDSTYELIRGIQKTDPAVRMVKLRRNFGQTPALTAGIDAARGNVIVTMDGDLQHDPDDIPLLLNELGKGFDIVCGWRQKRKENLLLRVIPSAIANLIIRFISGVKIHDFGGTFRAYRGDVIKKVEMFGEAHRFIPALSSDFGVSVSEVPIKSMPRKYGKSHYGFGRTFHVLPDLILLKFLLGYVRRPIHFFGSLFLLAFGIGAAISAVLMGLWTLRVIPDLRGHIAMLILSIFLMITGIQFLVLGILAELLARIYFESRHHKIYEIAETT